MNTVLNFYAYCVYVEELIDRFGSSDEFAREFEHRKRNIVEAIRIERYLRLDGYAYIDHRKKLLERSEPLFEDLKNWLNKAMGS